MTVGEVFPHASPTAFDAALKNRLQTASVDSPYSLAELRRQFAYDRFLVRVFSVESERWILKGGGGMLARIPDQARHSMDIDLFYRGELETAVEALNGIAADDSFGDFFSFDVAEEPGQFDAGPTGVKLAVAAFLGEKEFQRFKVDLVISSNMTQEPDAVSGLSPVVIPGLRTVDYVVYPMVDHIADKNAAMIDTYGSGDRPSSRYRDLVDLVLMATTQRLDAGELRAAMLSECEHRGLDVPSTVEAPDESWEAGYAREAAKVPHLNQQTLASALVVVRGFLVPVLDGTASGSWDPGQQTWLGAD